MTRAAYLARLAATNPEALRVSAELQEEIMSADRTEIETVLLDFATALERLGAAEDADPRDEREMKAAEAAHLKALGDVEAIALRLLTERRANLRTLSAAARGRTVVADQSGWHVGQSGER